MSDRVCIRGCVQRRVHYATCAWYGIEEKLAPAVAELPNAPKRCWGCAPKPARDHALICDGCFYRLRTLVRDADDLMGRLRSLADPMKATPTDRAPGSRAAAVEPPAPLDADLADAMGDIAHTLHECDRAARPRSLEQALSDLVNDAEMVAFLGLTFLDRHPLVDGLRDFWSVQDAVDKWGVERRTKGPNLWEPEPDSAEVAFARPEWRNPLLNRDDAAKLAGSLRTLQRWERNELIAPEGEIYTAGARTRLYRRSDVVRVRSEQEAKVGRPKGTNREVRDSASPIRSEP